MEESCSRHKVMVETSDSAGQSLERVLRSMSVISMGSLACSKRKMLSELHPAPDQRQTQAPPWGPTIGWLSPSVTDLEEGAGRTKKVLTDVVLHFNT